MPVENLRVLHVSEVLTGGIATYLNQLLPLQRSSFGAGQVGLVAPAEQLTQLSAATRSGICIFPYDRKSRRPDAWWRLHRAVTSSVSDFAPALIHAHSSFAGAICRLPAPRKPIVYTPHGWAFDMEASRFFRWGCALIERALAPSTHAVICVSKAERDNALARMLPAELLAVVHSGIRDSPIEPVAKSNRPGPIRLLFVGRFDEQKGLDWLLRVFKQLPCDRFTLQCVGDTVHGAPFKFPALPNLTVCGWQPQDALEEFYDRADAVIMPSRWEAFGFVAVEAMRRGTAVLASNRGGLPEVINEDECGRVFELEKPRRLIEFLLSTSRAELLSLGQAGRQRFLAHFTSGQMHRNTVAVYMRALV